MGCLKRLLNYGPPRDVFYQLSASKASYTPKIQPMSGDSCLNSMLYLWLSAFIVIRPICEKILIKCLKIWKMRQLSQKFEFATAVTKIWIRDSCHKNLSWICDSCLKIYHKNATAVSKKIVTTFHGLKDKIWTRDRLLLEVHQNLYAWPKNNRSLLKKRQKIDLWFFQNGVNEILVC